MGTFTKILKKIENAEREIKEAKELIMKIRDVIKSDYHESEKNKLEKIKRIINE